MSGTSGTSSGSGLGSTRSVVTPRFSKSTRITGRSTGGACGRHEAYRKMSASATAGPRLGAVTDVYADLFRYRELFGNLFRRDLRAKYKGSVLGVAWSLMHPLILMGIYLLVFSLLWRVTTIDHAPLFLLSGLAVWVFFSTSLPAASRSLLENANLIKKVRFPRQLVPLSVVATHLVSFIVMLVALLALDFALLPRVRPTEWLALPLGLGVVALASGIALTVASLDVLFRDVEFLVAALLLPLFFLTHVLYPLSD